MLGQGEHIGSGKVRNRGRAELCTEHQKDGLMARDQAEQMCKYKQEGCQAENGKQKQQQQEGGRAEQGREMSDQVCRSPVGNHDEQMSDHVSACTGSCQGGVMSNKVCRCQVGYHEQMSDCVSVCPMNCQWVKILCQH